jgi:hypothetical protein
MDPAGVMLAARKSRQNKDTKTNYLLILLMQARCQEATDPVDKVYALRGMATDAHRLTIPVDYNCQLFQSTRRRRVH